MTNPVADWQFQYGLYEGTAAVPTSARNTKSWALAASDFVASFLADQPDITPGNGLFSLESRTNLALQSNTFTDATWTKDNSSITAAATTSPDGSVDVSYFVPAANSLAHEMLQAFTTLASSDYTWTIYAKAGAYRYLGLFLAGETASIFDLQAGTFVAGAGGGYVTSSMTAVANGFYRLSYTYNTSGSQSFGIGVSSSGTVYTPAFAGDGTSGIYIYNAGLEAASFDIGQPILNTGASASTRLADANTQALAGTSEFGLRSAAHTPASYAADRILFQWDDGTANNRIYGYYHTDGHVYAAIVVSGTATTLDLGAVAVDTDIVVAMRGKAGNIGASLGGGTEVTATPAALPSGLTTMRFGHDSTPGSHWNSYEYARELWDAYSIDPVALSGLPVGEVFFPPPFTGLLGNVGRVGL